MSCSRGTVEDFFLAGRNLVWWQVSSPRVAPVELRVDLFMAFL